MLGKLACLLVAVSINTSGIIDTILPSQLAILESLEIERSSILSPHEHLDLQGKCKLYIHLQSLIVIYDVWTTHPFNTN